MAPPDFPPKTIETLAKRAALKCSNPDCGMLTIGPHSEEQKSVNLGEAAHIFGARADAARYRPEMTDFERSVISNGIWLCRVCHGLIDKDPSRFSPGLLLSWKANHEKSVLAEMGTLGDRLRQKEVEKELEKFSHLPAYARELIKDKPDYWEFLLTSEILGYYLTPRIRRADDFQADKILRLRKILSKDQIFDWLQSRIQDFSGVPPALEGLLQDLLAAWGEPGVTGDASEIDHVCQLFAEVADHLLSIAEDCRFTFLPEAYQQLADLQIEGALHVLRRLPELRRFLDATFVGQAPTGVVKFDLVIDLPDGWGERNSQAMNELLSEFYKGNVPI